MIEYLSWDSNFFGLKIGKVVYDQLQKTDLVNIKEEKIKHSFDLIYLFCSYTNEDCEKEIGGLLVDLKVTYHKKIANIPDYEASNVIQYIGPLNKDLLYLALESGQQSRFKKDIRLAAKYSGLYTEWINKSLDGSMADAVLVHYINDKIGGFVTVKNKAGMGHIGLIAVDKCEWGKGIGSKLLQAANQWYFQNKIDYCIVITQLDNAQACRMYEKNGYEIQKIERIYHI